MHLMSLIDVESLVNVPQTFEYTRGCGTILTAISCLWIEYLFTGKKPVLKLSLVREYKYFDVEEFFKQLDGD